MRCARSGALRPSMTPSRSMKCGATYAMSLIGLRSDRHDATRRGDRARMLLSQQTVELIGDGVPSTVVIRAQGAAAAVGWPVPSRTQELADPPGGSKLMPIVGEHGPPLVGHSASWAHIHVHRVTRGRAKFACRACVSGRSARSAGPLHTREVAGTSPALPIVVGAILGAQLPLRGLTLFPVRC